MLHHDQAAFWIGSKGEVAALASACDIIITRNVIQIRRMGADCALP